MPVKIRSWDDIPPPPSPPRRRTSRTRTALGGRRGKPGKLVERAARQLEAGQVEPKVKVEGSFRHFTTESGRRTAVRLVQERLLAQLGQQEELFFARVTAFCLQCPRCSHVYIVQGAMGGQAYTTAKQFMPAGQRLNRRRGRPALRHTKAAWNPRTSKWVCRACGLALWIGLYAHPVAIGGRSTPPPDTVLPWRALMRLRAELQGILAPHRLPAGKPVNRLLEVWSEPGPFWGDEQLRETVPLQPPDQPPTD